MLSSVIFKYGTDDIELWTLDIPEKAEAEIMEILMKYDSTGCSIRGTRKDIAEEITEHI